MIFFLRWFWLIFPPCKYYDYFLCQFWLIFAHLYSRSNEVKIAKYGLITFSIKANSIADYFFIPGKRIYGESLRSEAKPVVIKTPVNSALLVSSTLWSELAKYIFFYHKLIRARPVGWLKIMPVIKRYFYSIIFLAQKLRRKYWKCDNFELLITFSWRGNYNGIFLVIISNVWLDFLAWKLERK